MRTRKIKPKQPKGVAILVHPNLYNKIELERIKWMKKKGLDRLTTKAFTGIFAEKLVKNDKRKKR